jgi:hypothetical protein
VLPNQDEWRDTRRKGNAKKREIQNLFWFLRNFPKNSYQYTGTTWLLSETKINRFEFKQIETVWEPGIEENIWT